MQYGTGTFRITAGSRSRWIAALLLCFGLITGAYAADDTDPFTATVPVDATADSPVKARDMARLQGQRRALEAVAEHFANGAASVKMPKLDDKAITNLVASFEVADERMSAVRYLATYTFHFRPAETRRALGVSASAGTAASTTVAAAADQATAKPLIVLPLYQTSADAAPELWEEPNPWREAWDKHPPSKGGVRLSLPLGDAGDVAAIDAAKARDGNAAALNAIARRNGADDVVVALAVLQGGADKPSGVDVSLRRYHAGQLVDTHGKTVAAKPGESGSELLASAVAAVGADIASGAKEASLPHEQQGSLTAVLPINGLEDWVHARDRIAAVSLVRKVTLVALSRQEATIEIAYTGSIDQLKDSLATARLDLERGSPTWRLMPAEAARIQ
jgi:hypothetical protein